MRNWVVLFVRTGHEEKIRDALSEHLNVDENLPFVPHKETPYRRKGIVHRERKILFSGYVFIQTVIEPILIANKLRPVLEILKGNKHVYSLLCNGNNKNDVIVQEAERRYWEGLFDENFCIRGSVGFIVGDVTRVTSGPLMGMEGKIKRINRHRREAIVEMRIMGTVREVSLMLEIVEKKR